MFASLMGLILKSAIIFSFISSTTRFNTSQFGGVKNFASPNPTIA